MLQTALFKTLLNKSAAVCDGVCVAARKRLLL